MQAYWPQPVALAFELWSVMPPKLDRLLVEFERGMRDAGLILLDHPSWFRIDTERAVERITALAIELGGASKGFSLLSRDAVEALAQQALEKRMRGLAQV